MASKKLSICLIVKNEERYLSRSLASIKEIANEIILVDTGSTDKTIEIARKYTDKIYNFEWCDDFSKARNYALDKANGEWILFIDGDEELAPQSIEPLLKRISENNIEGYLVTVNNYYNNGKKTLTVSDSIFRFFKYHQDYRYSGSIHEQILENILTKKPQAKIVMAEDIILIHYGYLQNEINVKNKIERNINILKKIVDENPDNLLNRFHLGVEYYRSQQLEKALFEFEVVHAKVKKEAIIVPKLMRYITTCKFLLGKPLEALQFIDEVWMKKLPDQGDLYYMRGVICRDLKRYTEAYNSFKKSLSVPFQPAYYANQYCQYKDRINYELFLIESILKDKE